MVCRWGTDLTRPAVIMCLVLWADAHARRLLRGGQRLAGLVPARQMHAHAEPGMPVYNVEARALARRGRATREAHAASETENHPPTFAERGDPTWANGPPQRFVSGERNHT